MEDFVVGDRVVVRTVDEMIESGRFDYSTMSTYLLLDPIYPELDLAFNKRMQYLCGQTGVISQIINDYRTEIKIEFDDPFVTLERDNYNTWHITPGMVKHVPTPTVSDDDIFNFLDEF